MTRTILLADDDASVRETLARVLELEHYDVVQAGTGGEAAAKFRAYGPDLVLVDLELVEPNGGEGFEAMSGTEPPVPVVIITARPHQYKHAARLGADALMEKPLHLPLLLETIKDLLAESIASRLARVKGGRARCHYLPVWPEAQPSCSGGTC